MSRQHYETNCRRTFENRNILRPVSKPGTPRCDSSNRCVHWDPACPGPSREENIDLDIDLQHHIQHCPCTCNHLGYGNYMDYQTQCSPDICQEMSNMDYRMENHLRCNGNLRPIESPCKQSYIPGSYKMYVRPNILIFVSVLSLITLLIIAGNYLLNRPNKTEELIQTKQDASLMNHEERLKLVHEILKKVPLIDGHNDLATNIRYLVQNKLKAVNFSMNLRVSHIWKESRCAQTDIPKLRAGMVGAQFWTAFVPCGSQYMNAVQLALEQIDVIQRFIMDYPNDLQFAASVKEIIEVHKSGKIASLIGLEGGTAIGDSIGVLRTLYSLGVRYMALVHMCRVSWAGCCGSEEAGVMTYPEDNRTLILQSSIRYRGLTAFGKVVVKEMNRLGMIIDLNRASWQTAEDAMNISSAPIMFIRSGAFSICASNANVPDHILTRIVETDGIVMVPFYSKYISCSENATIDDVIAHINHIRKIAGEDHVGIAAGYDGADHFPHGLETLYYPELFARLMKDGAWKEEQIEKLAGLNFLRVFEKIEKTSIMLKEQNMKPEEASIFQLHSPSDGKLPLQCRWLMGGF